MPGESILIVDDNETTLRLARMLLLGEGYVVETANDATAALGTLTTFRPRLILLESQLPGTDGLALTRKLKADPTYRDIMIIALTADPMKGHEGQTLAAGWDGYVTKPIDPRVLSALIATYLATTR